MARDPSPVNALARDRRRPRWPVLLLALGLGGCSWLLPPPTPRGNRVPPEVLSQVTPGVQTRADVQSLFGSPTARGTFDDNHWYYISARTQVAPGAFLRVEDRRVIEVTFDNAGVVREVRELTEADGRRIAFVSRETPVPGNERTLLQQLFGNIGRPTMGAGDQQQIAPGPGRL